MPLTVQYCALCIVRMGARAHICHVHVILGTQHTIIAEVYLIYQGLSHVAQHIDELNDYITMKKVMVTCNSRYTHVDHIRLYK